MTLDELLADLGLLGCRLELSKTGWPQLVPPRPYMDLEPVVRDQIGRLLPHLRELRMEIVAALAEHCPLCEKVLPSQEDKDRQKDPLFCPEGGCREAYDAHGNYHPARPRCPYKDSRRDS